MSADKMRRRRSIYSMLSWVFFSALGLWLLSSFVLLTAGLSVSPVAIALGVTVLGSLGGVFRALANGPNDPDGDEKGSPHAS